jgi:hypothetical protein
LDQFAINCSRNNKVDLFARAMRGDHHPDQVPKLAARRFVKFSCGALGERSGSVNARTTSETTTALSYQPRPQGNTQTSKAFSLCRSAKLCPSYPNIPGETIEDKGEYVSRIATPLANDLSVYKTPSNRARQDVELFYNLISAIVLEFS